MSRTNLKTSEGRVGVLRFSDGHAVKARLVHVDEDDRCEVVYDVLAVQNRGPSKWSGVEAGVTAVGSITDIAGFELLPDG